MQQQNCSAYCLHQNEKKRRKYDTLMNIFYCFQSSEHAGKVRSTLFLTEPTNQSY